MADAEAEAELIDPTDVVGRRMAGWLVDVALVVGTVLVVVLVLGDSFERPGPDTDLDFRRVGSDSAIFFRSTVAVVHAWEWLVAAGAGVLSALILLVLLPSWRGWSPGLLAAELRLVDREGAPVGLRAAMVRLVGWVIDILPGVPLVGLAAMRFGRHHQRIGDRLAHTYVVDRAHAGSSPTEPASGTADSRVTTVPADDASLTGAVGAGEALTEKTTVQRRWGLRRRRDHQPTESSESTGAASSPSSGSDSAPAIWAPEDGPKDQEGRRPAGSPRGAKAQTAPDDQHRGEGSRPGRTPEGVTADEPHWDREEKRYVMWHGATGRWVGYDDAEQSWKPL